MSKSIFYFVVGVALLVTIVAVTAYIAMFGHTPSVSHEIWGLFGDYFGGLLNPIFAMLAFIALLWSIMLQAREFRSASDLLSQQVRHASDQLQILKDTQNREDFIHVIKDIDSRLTELLSRNISLPETHPQLSIAHMVSEGQRLARGGGDSPVYSAFIEGARSSGSIVEVYTREIIHLISNMREVLGYYSQFEQNNFSPVISYYANKVYQLIDMLEDIGGIEDDTRQFFASVSDQHG